MTARRTFGRDEVRINCDHCPAQLHINSDHSFTVDDARDAANVEHGWTNDGKRDRCPDCTVRLLTYGVMS